FLGSEKYVTDDFKVEINERTNVKTAPDSCATSQNKVYVAGDMHTGQSLVVKAVAQGKEVAKEVDKALMGYTNL
ncbi:MAG: glutamate synthase, partial [Lachnospiraceae bacterium]|nr:glutamate synthase [Lachnospiraceae bacterium]